MKLCHVLESTSGPVGGVDSEALGYLRPRFSHKPQPVGPASLEVSRDGSDGGCVSQLLAHPLQVAVFSEVREVAEEDGGVGVVGDVLQLCLERVLRYRRSHCANVVVARQLRDDAVTSLVLGAGTHPVVPGRHGPLVLELFDPQLTPQHPAKPWEEPGAHESLRVQVQVFVPVVVPRRNAHQRRVLVEDGGCCCEETEEVRADNNVLFQEDRVCDALHPLEHRRHRKLVVVSDVEHGGLVLLVPVILAHIVVDEMHERELALGFLAKGRNLVIMSVLRDENVVLLHVRELEELAHGLLQIVYTLAR
mmetsp:Transcript_11858/g.28348  ORF Transcript_11858/g.28348 Transcript_11858/m.28348 type:complete len:306 (-) Transcript_11858:699-1616(-)